MGSKVLVAAVVVLVAMMSLCLQVRADTVTIYNDMGPGVALAVKCYHGYGNLGYHVMPPRGSVKLEFPTSPMGLDVVECTFYSQGMPAKKMHVYEGFNLHTYFCRCRDCHWSVAKSGLSCEGGQYTEKWQ